MATDGQVHDETEYMQVHADGGRATLEAVGRHGWDCLLPAAVVTGAAVAVGSTRGDAVTPTGAAWVLCTLVLAVAAALWLPFTAQPELRTVPGRLMTTRAVLVVAAGLLWLAPWRSDGADGSWPTGVVGVLVAVLVLTLTIGVEPIVQRVLDLRIRFVAQLPGIRPVAPIPALGPAVQVASLVGILAGPGVLLVGLPAWTWGVVACLCGVPTATLAVIARRRLAERARMERGLVSAVRKLAPQFIVYTARPDDASYQVTMWLPYLQRAGVPFLIVCRRAEPAAALARLTDAPVVHCHRLSDVEDLLVDSVGAAFYVNASSGNGELVRFPGLTHVYLGHGDSDKPPSYNPTHAMYDQIFAAGPAATRRYAAHGVAIAEDKFRVVGRPQVEDVQRAAGPISGVEQPTVLYAPTWRGHVEETKLSSLSRGAGIVTALLERGARVIFRPHPFSYTFPDDAREIARVQELLAADARRTGRDHLWGPPAETERTALECMNAADAMVSDVSSVVSDFLFSGKPFAMVAVPATPDVFVDDYPIARAAYVVDGDLGNLDQTLAELLTTDPMAGQRDAIRADYLGDFDPEHYADVFVEAVRDVARRTDRADATAADDSGASRTRRSAGPDGMRTLAMLAARTFSVTITALISLAVVVLQGPLWVAALVAALCAALMAYSLRREARKPMRRGLLLGEYDLARGILVLGVGLALLRAEVSPLVLVGTILLLVAGTGEDGIRQGWTVPDPVAANLPGVPAQVREWLGRSWLAVTQCAVLLVGWLVAVLGLPPALWFALTVVQALLFLDGWLRSAVRVHRAAVTERDLTGAVESYAPAFAVYFSSTVGIAYQVGMWLPYLERIGTPFVIVVRSPAMLAEIAERTTRPVIHRPTLRSLEDVIVDSMTTAFYVNNAVRNTHFVERRELTHVWLNHGDSEKPACYNPVHAIYDLIFAAGQAGVDRYARHGVDIPASMFRIVGRPQVEQIDLARAPIHAIERPTVLYAPTWRGPYSDSAVYSLPVGHEIVRALLQRGVRVIFRAHPFNHRFPESQQMIKKISGLLAADRAATGVEHLWGSAAEEELGVQDCFNLSDAMVSDVSAMVSDYLKSQKPFAMVAVKRTPAELLTQAPVARAAYVVAGDLSNLAEALDLLLVEDPAAAERRRTRVYYLGEFGEEDYADGFLDAARDVIERGAHVG